MKKRNQLIILLAIFWLPLLTAKGSFGEEAGNAPLVEKPDNTKDIKRILEKFQSYKVTSYVEAATNPGNGLDEVFIQPKEYEDAVDAGKPMVPYLLDLLSNQDAGIRLSAYLALCDITDEDIGNRKIFFDERNAQGSVERHLYKKKWEDWWAKNKTKTRVQWLLDDIHEVDIDGIYENKYPMTGKSYYLNTDSQRFLDQLWSKVSAIQKLGDCGDKAAIPELRKLVIALKYLRTDHWMVVNSIDYAVDSLQKLGDRCAIPDLIDIMLRNDMEMFREKGQEQIEKLAGVKFSFDPNAPQAIREESIAKIERWWEENKDVICK